jgi:hypothetical protein
VEDPKRFAYAIVENANVKELVNCINQVEEVV